MIAWFRSLPLYLDLAGIRVIHACWHPRHLQTLSRYTDDNDRILTDAWPALNRKDTEAYEAIETVLKGPEIRLPADTEFTDQEGNSRRNVRIQWWDAEGITYRDLAMVPSEVIESIPHEPIPEDIRPDYVGDKPLFVGHYWMSGTPAPLTPHIACLDYSIAATRGQSHHSRGLLCAYRWDGEPVLDPDHFVWVSGSAA